MVEYYIASGKINIVPPLPEDKLAALKRFIASTGHCSSKRRFPGVPTNFPLSDWDFTGLPEQAKKCAVERRMGGEEPWNVENDNGESCCEIL